jgi:phenylacetate-CoA ligase
LAIFAEYLIATGRDFHRPRTVICTAEPMLPEQRSLINQAFGVKAFNHYGSRDFGMIAAECELHDGLHVNPAAVFMEYVRGSDTDVSEVLITDILNRGMPMLRYRVNDCAEAGGQCACGRGYPLMRALEGRSADNFYLANGDVVPGVAFTNRLIKVCHGIRKMQLIQEDYGRFTIRYVPSETFSESDLDQVRNKFLEFLGDRVEVTFESVVEIAREHSGKTRFAISKVARPALSRS